MNHLYLCGFMGCGKSTVGSQLAKSAGCRFIDLDEYIVEQAGCTIPEIFQTRGEDAFRKLESDSLTELADKPRMVVATGGGTLMREQNAVCVKQSGTVVFLNIPFEECYTRIQGDQNRPVAARSTKQELLALYEARKKIYLSVCDIEIRQTMSPLATAREILQQAAIAGNIRTERS